MPKLQVSENDVASDKLQSGIIQRKCSGCTGKLHSQHPKRVKPGTEAHINAVRSGGQSLPENVRTFYEPRFGHDFSHVRVHTDPKAAEAARAVNARAFLHPGLARRTSRLGCETHGLFFKQAA